MLAISHTGATPVISWPTNTPSGYNLYSNPDLADAGGWELAAESIVVQGEDNTVTVNPALARRFFRLQKPVTP